MKKTIYLFLIVIFILTTSSCYFRPINQNTSDNQTNEITNENTTNSKTKTYLVVFDSDGGSEVETQDVEYQHTVIRPTNPTKEGYTFDGWYVGDEKWDFLNDIVTNDVKLKAKWICHIIYSINNLIHV